MKKALTKNSLKLYLCLSIGRSKVLSKIDIINLHYSKFRVEFLPYYIFFINLNMSKMIHSAEHVNSDQSLLHLHGQE